jgi:DNA polymerase I-like protein with 3'-5' exonuclease and polymerase domains
MIKVFNKTTDDVGELKRFDSFEFTQWLSKQTSFQFDVETTTSPYWCERKLMTMQFGSNTEDLQYVFQWKHIVEDPAVCATIVYALESWEVEKIIHNAAFEYIVCRFHNIEIHNMFCTMLAEKVINGGIENADYALLDISEKYCGVTLDKTYQTAFGDGILTYGKVVYAADDVKYLAEIQRVQLIELKKWDLLNVVDLENKVCMAFSDMTYYGMTLDVGKWKENINLAQPIIDSAKIKLDNWIREDPKLRAKAIELGYLKLEDTANFNLNSPTVKLELLKLEFPDIIGATKIILQKYIRDNELNLEHVTALHGMTIKDYTYMSTLLVKNHRDKLIELGYLFPANHIEINWNSQTQVLPLLKAVEPKLKDLSAESFGKTTHPIISDLEEYKDNLKLVSSYGEKFLTLLEPDGKIRANYNQIVSTGRSSCSKPNLQQIPARESVGNRYRNCFIYDTGWTFVDSDFTGQELALIAHVAKDEVWYQAIINGEDLHSVCAEMVFKSKWKDGADADCAYYKSRQKCKCKAHKTMRNGIKTVNFGLCYGMSHFKLASTLKIPLKEAETLIEDYFKAFPKIKQILNYLTRFGITKGYIQTLAPFFRKRRFPTWHYSKSNIENHLSGVQYDSNLGSIGRQSSNMPIQGSGADLMKWTMWLVYKYLRENNLTDKVHMVACVHDQLTTTCTSDFSEKWAKELDALMCEGALKVVTSGILKADTQCSQYWTK